MLTKPTQTLNAHMDGLRTRVFDVGLQHLLLAQEDTKARQAVTGRVINCLMLGSASLPPSSLLCLSLQSNSFLQTQSQFYCRQQQAAFDSFPLIGSLHILEKLNKPAHGKKSCFHPLLHYWEEME